MTQVQLSAPKQAQNISLMVAVRVRPILKCEIDKGRGAKDILRVMDDCIVLVMDPDPDDKDYLDQVQNRSKEKQYTFDRAFHAHATNSDVYSSTIAPLITHALHGINCTVFAYGATGSGKTYTMVGDASDPGLMVRSIEALFMETERFRGEEAVSITASYLEVYNEVIYDLLVPNSNELQLREDPVLGAVPSGLTRLDCSSAQDILRLLEQGNSRRKTERTDANARSSRSHAVLEVQVKRTRRNHYKARQLLGKLSLVDLAGSERAADTNNIGQKLRDGANINRSLLALANCINALGKASAAGGRAYVPYRNSKLTRLLKDGLSGNSRTAMIATVAAASDQYNHSINTLKYADRAKEIRTHIVQNVGSVESHISDYRRIIDNLQAEVRNLKEQLGQQEEVRHSLGGLDRQDSSTQAMQLVNQLVDTINKNVAEGINYHKALFEVRDATGKNRRALQALQLKTQSTSLPEVERQLAEQEQQHLIESIRENDAEEGHLQSCIAANESEKARGQQQIQAAMATQADPHFKQMLNQCQIQALQLQEMEFHMVMRDTIISAERQKVEDLWAVLGKLAGEDRIQQVASELEIQMEHPEIGSTAFRDHHLQSSAATAAAAAATASTSAAGGPASTLDIVGCCPPRVAWLQEPVQVRPINDAAPGQEQEEQLPVHASGERREVSSRSLNHSTGDEYLSQQDKKGSGDETLCMVGTKGHATVGEGASSRAAARAMVRAAGRHGCERSARSCCTRSSREHSAGLQWTSSSPVAARDHGEWGCVDTRAELSTLPEGAVPDFVSNSKTAGIGTGATDVAALLETRSLRIGIGLHGLSGGLGSGSARRIRRKSLGGGSPDALAGTSGRGRMEGQCLLGGGICIQEVAERERERPAGRIVSGNVYDRLRSLRRETRGRSSRAKGTLAAGAGLRTTDDSIVVVGGGVALAQHRR